MWKLSWFVLTSILSLCCCRGYCQVPLTFPPLAPEQVHREVTPESYRLAVIQTVIHEGTPISRVRLLHRMGDDAAVNVIKTIGMESSQTEAEKDTILAILDSAFARPSAIVTASDRQPRVTFFLLQSLERSSEDAAVKARIVQIRSHIESAVGMKGQGATR